MRVQPRNRAKAVGILAACWTLSATPSGVAYASDGERPKRPVGIEELNVTARKREERLQDVPIAVTALSGAQLEDYDIRRIQDLDAIAPNLSFGTTAEASTGARVHLRGVGNADPISSDDSGVGIYLDGVYLSRAQAALFTISDIERVEVLRGPQGTLFGKNTIGGAVNVVTRKPNFDGFGATAEVRVGNFSRFDTRLALNIPIMAERAAARVSLATATRDAFQDNKGTGPDLDNDKLLGIRTQLLVTPTEDLELMLSLDGTRENRKPPGFKCKVLNRFGVGQNAQNSPQLAQGTEFRSAPSAALFTQQAGTGGGVAGLTNLATGANPFLAACDEDDRRGNRTVNSELSFQKEYLKTYGGALTANWSISDALELKSITSVRTQKIDDARDFDATPFALLTADAKDAGGEDQRQLTQELQLTGDAVGGRLTYVAGLFWLSEATTDDGFTGLGTGQTFLFPQNPAMPTALVNSLAGFQSDRLKVDNYSYAAYGQGTYELTKRLSLTMGARLTSERKEIERNIVCQTGDFAAGVRCPAPGTELFFFNGSTRSKDISPITTLKYELNDNSQVYGTWSRGFKSGGFNGRANRSSLVDPVDDENTTSYELGFKSLFLDNRLRLNAALFYSIYEDIQLTTPRGNPTTNQLEVVVKNAGRAEIKGAELELRAILAPGLELSSALGVANAGYTRFDDPSDPSNPMNPEDPKDRRLPNTPNYTMNFGANYQLAVGSLGDLRLRANWTHIGASAIDVEDSRALSRPKHGELDAQIGWLMADGVTEVMLFGDNLLDREYVANGINLGASFGHALRLYNARRTYGLEVRRSF